MNTLIKLEMVPKPTYETFSPPPPPQTMKAWRSDLIKSL